jgi:hypothetical protein
MILAAVLGVLLTVLAVGFAIVWLILHDEDEDTGANASSAQARPSRAAVFGVPPWQTHYDDDSTGWKLTRDQVLGGAA